MLVDPNTALELITLGWILIALPIGVGMYAYVIYPLILWIIASGRPQKTPNFPPFKPEVCVVLPAYNEEAQIGGAIEALLAQDYPAEKVHILVISDASTDATDSIAGSYASRGVQLVRMPQRGGKTRAENGAWPHMRGDIMVNTDASIRLHPSAISQLVLRMADPEVGVASGRDVSISKAQAMANLTEAGYVQYEMRIRALETRTGGIVGASGSCYAILSKLQQIPIRDDLSRDFSAALTAHANGYRAISVDEAICFVPRTSSLRIEFKRKVRTLNRGMDTLYNSVDLLNPATHGAFAWKLLSHKVARWALPVAAIPGVVGLLILADFFIWARWLFGGVLAVGFLAIAGTAWPPTKSIPKILSIAAFGIAANLAVIIALSRLLRRKDDAIWEPTRREANAP